MKKTTLISTLFLLLLSICVYGQSSSNKSETEYAVGEVIVKLKDSPEASNRNRLGKDKIDVLNIDAICSKYGQYQVENFKALPIQNSVQRRNRPKFENIAILRFKDKVDIKVIIQELNASGLLEYAEPNYLCSGSAVFDEAPQGIPNDYISRLYWAKNDGSFTGFTSGQPNPVVGADVDAVEAWDITTGSSSIVLAVCDTGIDPTNQEFSGRIVSGYDFVNSDSNPIDDQGHGTNVTGIATMTGNNNFGLAGMDWKCKIMPVKVLDSNNKGTWANLAQGITFAVDNGADVINMSIGGSNGSQTLYTAIQYAANNGVTMVASMGNDDANVSNYPASYAETIAVGATDLNDHRVRKPFTNNSWGSNYANYIDLVAPGNTMVSARYNNNQSFSWWMGGTSQATPLVSGAATLLLSVNPNLSPGNIRSILKNSADDQVGNPSEDVAGFDIFHGAGRLNVHQALLSLNSNPCSGLTNPGIITGDQTGCGSYDPSVFLGTTATGSGTIQYTWERRGISACGGSNYGPWVESPNNIAFLDVGSFSGFKQQWRRGARIAGCTSYSYSNIITLTKSCVSPGTITGDQSDCVTFDPAGFSGTLAVGYGGGSIEYTWERRFITSCGGTTYGPWSESPNNIAYLNVGAFTGFKQQWRRGARIAGCSITNYTFSNIVTLTNQCVDPGTITGDQTDCSGFDPAGFSGTPAISHGGGNIEYTWERRTITSTCSGTSYGPWGVSQNNIAFLNVGPFAGYKQQWRRGARTEGCTNYSYSNIVTLTNDCGCPVNSCTNLLPQQQHLVLGGRSMIIIRGVDTTTHTWKNTDTELATFETELDAYLKKTSFNKAWLGTSDMTPVYNFTVDPNNNGYYSMGQKLKTIAESNGYNVSSYNIVVYIHSSSTSFGGAGALGSGNGLNGTIWANNSLSFYYPGNIHETFHALGQGHAETIEGGTEMFPGNPTGGHDPYHFMGSQGDAGMDSDIPSYMKYRLGWIDPANVSCVESVTSCETVRLYKGSLINNYNTQRQYAAQLGDNLWLSYEPDNANSRIEKKGVLLHYIPGPGAAVSRLIDTRPGSITQLPAGVGSNFLPVIDFWDAAMELGDTISWITGETIIISNIGGSGEDKWVDIEFCDCLAVEGDDDNDGVCNPLDKCSGGDDTIDNNTNGIPDACESSACSSQATENFDYPVNSMLDGANGGVGFDSAWVSSSSSGTMKVLSGSLSYPGQSNSGNRIEVDMTNTSQSKRSTRILNEPFLNGAEVWISCLIKPTVIANGGFWIQPNGKQGIAIGKRWGSEIGIDNNGTGINVQQNVVTQLVVRYKLEQSRTVAHIWVNRSNNFTDANADATKTVGAMNYINKVVVAMSHTGNGKFELDDLKVSCYPFGDCNPALPGTACNDNNPFTTDDKFDASCNCIGVLNQCTNLDVSFFLEGPLDQTSNTMNTDLYDQSFLPTTQPYNVAPWNHPRSEGSGMTLADFPNSSVDWVLVSLRTDIDPSTEIFSAAAMLQSDGSLFFPECRSINDGSYYIVVKHRNHMGAMSPVKVTLSNNSITYDFTTQNSYTSGVGIGQKQINGIWALLAGDYDKIDFPSFDINGADKVLWKSDNGTFGTYIRTDGNLNGDVNGNDNILWDSNTGNFSTVPK